MYCPLSGVVSLTIDTCQSIRQAGSSRAPEDPFCRGAQSSLHGLASKRSCKISALSKNCRLKVLANISIGIEETLSLVHPLIRLPMLFLGLQEWNELHHLQVNWHARCSVMSARRRDPEGPSVDIT